MDACCNESARFNFHSKPTAIIEVDEQRFTLYPNPAADKVYLKDYSLAGCNIRYAIINPLGRVIAGGITYNPVAGIDVSGLPGGLYFIHIWSGFNRGKFFKFFKN